MTMTIVHLMQGNVPGLVRNAANLILAFFNVQDTMTIVHLMQVNAPGLVGMQPT
jgi:hypothetical protein